MAAFISVIKMLQLVITVSVIFVKEIKYIKLLWHACHCLPKRKVKRCISLNCTYLKRLTDNDRLDTYLQPFYCTQSYMLKMSKMVLCISGYKPWCPDDSPTKGWGGYRVPSPPYELSLNKKQQILKRWTHFLIKVQWKFSCLVSIKQTSHWYTSAEDHNPVWNVGWLYIVVLVTF